MKLIARFLKDTKGATAIEYALIASIISIVIVSSSTMIGSRIVDIFELVQDGFETTP